ncbi:transmembrane protein 209-like protein, partial [Leptotrombidium deliense]
DDSLMNKVMERKQKIYDSRNAFLWGLINLFFALLFTMDICNGFMFNYFTSYSIVLLVKLIESVVTLIFTLNAVYDFALYSWPYCWMKPIEVTPEQKKLFAIKDNELGFVTTPKTSTESKSKSFGVTPPFVLYPENSSPSMSFLNKSSGTSPPTVQSKSFLSSTPNMSFNYSSVGDTSASSWIYSQNISDAKKPSPDSSFSSLNNSFLKRRNISAANSIKDESGLEEYLKNFDLVEEKLHEMNKSEQQQLRNQSFTFADQSGYDLQTSKYQPASDVVATPSIESSLSSNMKAIDEVFRLNCSELQLYQWIENIRSWISQTILSRLVKEIDKINDSLSRSGMTESLVGEIGLSSLKQLASLKHKEIPTLSVVLPYLELSLNQEYLVQRLKDLAKGGCITEFNWNRGASHKGKQWSEEWPADAQIVMHLFCTYMDSRLPAHPSCADGKPFTTMYFKTAAEHSSSKSQFYILQTKLNPPHYNVAVQGEGIIEVPSGRNNIFYSIILFLHVININRCGLLGYVFCIAFFVNEHFIVDELIWAPQV